MSGIFDTHAHYTDGRFASWFEGGVCTLLPQIFDCGVDKIINVGTSTRNSIEAIRMAGAYPRMYASVGVHPSDIEREISLDAAMATIRDLLVNREDKKIVAVGEIGLDYHWRQDNKAEQMRFFEAQLSIAEDFDIPVIIHDREAHGDVFETVLRHPKVCGVFHCYSGSLEMARELIRRGWYISFSGVLTYKNAKNVRLVAEGVSLDRILVETDAPYLAPEPYRGKMNRSDYIAYTIAVLAQLRGMSDNEICEITNRNACTLFGI